MNLDFEKRIGLEIKLLGVAVLILGIVCTVHTLLLIS